MNLLHGVVKKLKKNDQMKKIFAVDHGTYPFDMLVCIGVKDEEIFKNLKKHKVELNNEEKESLLMEGTGRTVMLKGGQTVLRVANIKSRAEFNAVLSHEIFHAVEFLFDRIGFEYSFEASEAFAYQIEYITGSIYEELYKKKK